MTTDQLSPPFSNWRCSRELATIRELFDLFFSRNEESPFTRTETMGSLVYAQACRENGDKIAGMLCLETLGCYSEEIGSQWLSFGGVAFSSPRQFHCHRGRSRVPTTDEARNCEPSEGHVLSLSPPDVASEPARRAQLRSLVFLEEQFSGSHVHRYGAVSLSALSFTHRYPR